MVETKNQLHEFRNENGASLRRITPSTQVGRLSASHSDIGFRLTQFPGGKKVRERQGEKVRALVLFEQSVDRSAVASICATQLHEKAAKEKKGLREGIMNHQWNQKRRIGTAWSKVKRSFDVPSVVGSRQEQTREPPA